MLSSVISFSLIAIQDNGYDISDYPQIMDVFGTMADVEELVKAVHDRKMRIIFDLVLNHTSEYEYDFCK